MLFRVVSRLCLLVATVAPILLFAGLLAYAVTQRNDLVEAVYSWFADTIGGRELAQFAAFFVPLGIAGTLLGMFGRVIWGNVKALCQSTWSVVKGSWIPDCESDDFKETWDMCVVPIPGEFFKSFFSVWRLLAFLFAVAAVFGAVWLGQQKPEDKRHVIVVTHQVKPETLRTYLGVGSVFSLMHLDDAKFSRPNSGLGVCLDGAKKEWLEAFKDAMQKCMLEASEEDLACEPGESPCPVLKVTGYASIAPEQGDVPTPCGLQQEKTFNCKVANLRARAVGAFLADGDKKHWQCPDKELFDGTSDCPAEHCKGESTPLQMTVDLKNGKTRTIGVTVEQWARETQMRDGKPANDGEDPKNRRYRVEVLNRSVHIEVMRDFCAVREPAT